MGKYSVAITPTFEKEFRKLRKRFAKIDEDFEIFLDEIEVNGDLGNPLSGIKLTGSDKGNKVFKKRMKNSSASQGKSGGFRVIHYLLTSTNEVYLLDIYSKSDSDDISKNEVQDVVKQNNEYIHK